MQLSFGEIIVKYEIFQPRIMPKNWTKFSQKFRHEIYTIMLNWQVSFWLQNLKTIYNMYSSVFAKHKLATLDWWRISYIN